MKSKLTKFIVGSILSLFLLLSNNTLSFSQELGTILGTVKSHKGTSLANVKLFISALDTIVTANKWGEYALTIPVGSYTLEASLWGYAPVHLLVNVYKGDSITTDFTLQEISLDGSNLVVIGTRNASRIQLQSPVPVDVVRVEEILAENPQADLNQLLMYIIPSFQANRQTIADGTDHIDPASLRGLGPDQVLILVNGKRRHTSSLVNVNGTIGKGSVGTDLNAIPIAAVKRIEVLRDGAAAQYGSDAIAGVINIVLKDGNSGVDMSLVRGEYQERDGAFRQLGMNYGVKVGKKSFVNVTGEISLREATNRMNEFTGNIFSATGENDAETLVVRNLQRSDFNMRVGNAAIQNRGLFFNSSFGLADQTKLYAFGGIGYRNGQSTGFYRLPYKSQTVTEIYPNGFLPEIHSTIFDESLTIGLRGKVNQWNVDMSNTFGENNFSFQIENTNNASLERFSPTSFYAGGFSFMQNTTNIDFNRLLPNVKSGLNIAFGSEIRLENYKIKAGEEASYTNYGLRDIFALDTILSIDGSDSIYYQKPIGQIDVLGKPGGAQVFPGFKPSNEVNKNRTSFASYIDVELDFTPRFMIAGAVRFEKYSDFGSTINGKLAARYKMEKDYAIRATISTGFRAPSLHQRFFNSTSTQFVDGIPLEVGTFTNDSKAAQLLGIPSLKEETSRNYNIGLLARPTNNLDITIDGYYIHIHDRIVLTGRFGGDEDEHIKEILQEANATTASFFSNAVNTQTIGVEFMASYTKELKSGILKLSLLANIGQSKIASDIKTSELLSQYPETYFNREDEARLSMSNPNKINLTSTYRRGRTSIMLRNIYFGKITYFHPADGLSENWINNEFTGRITTRDQIFSGKIVTDVSVTYQFTPKIKLTVGANNLFNVYPDKHTHSANNNEGRFPYSRRITQFGFNGAYYFSKFSIKL